MKIEKIEGYIKVARFDHWIKQLFIIPGIIIAHYLVNDRDRNLQTVIINGIIVFLSTSFIASANYVINEWLDAAFDKFHPTKKNRAIVSMDMKVRYIILEYVIFVVIGLLLAWFASRYVLYMIICLLFMGVVYNVNPIRTKEIPYLDVLSESINNAIRMLIGWFIVTPYFLPPVSIVFGYWMGGAFLMATKRFAEYRMIGNKEQAVLYRKSFKYYTEQSILISSFFYALLSVFFCGIFMIKYKIELLIAIPFLCGLFCYYLNMSYKYDSSVQKPEKLFREKGLVMYVFAFILLVGLLMCIHVPFLNVLLETAFIGV